METVILDDAGLARVEKVLDYLARRHEVISANIANVSTPGYKTVDVRFQDVLQGELDGFKIVQTSPRHFEVVAPEPELTVVEMTGLPQGLDGNNVAMDQELLKMTLNRLRFQMGIQWATSRLRTMRSAIQEGGAR